jgi:hypothetical protein
VFTLCTHYCISNFVIFGATFFFILDLVFFVFMVKLGELTHNLPRPLALVKVNGECNFLLFLVSLFIYFLVIKKPGTLSFVRRWRVYLA